jgi:hypothetical protein
MSISEKNAPWKPAPGTKFMRRDVEKVVKSIIAERIGDKPYNYAESMQISKDLCTLIQESVQDMNYNRYKLVVQVIIAENCNQGIRVSSRCLWDSETDGFAEFTHSTGHMHVTALVFGLYWE